MIELLEHRALDSRFGVVGKGGRDLLRCSRNPTGFCPVSMITSDFAPARWQSNVMSPWRWKPTWPG